MDINNLKYIVGKVEANEPAVIRFFGSVNPYSVECFNEEFLWLQNHVKPSKIIVLINSEGGSVICGMSVFSVIQGCPIEVDCVIEGIAASMGSIIWAAGDNLYMHDYSLLMIHNPFSNCSADDSNAQQVVGAFKAQIATIYQKRFGMSAEQVAEIMDGEEGKNGTFFTAAEAVKAGFIMQDKVIATSQQVRDKVKSQMDGQADIAPLREFMSKVAAEIDENKLLKGITTIHNRETKTQFQESEVMEQNENTNFDTISAQLGFSKDAQMASITARVAELIKTENDLNAIRDQYTALEIKFNGKEAEIGNVKSELEQVKASLKKYQDAEAAAFEAEMAQTVEDAIKAGKIEESAKEAWLTMAHADFATVKATLASIQARENITERIATDPGNIQAQEEALKPLEQKVKEQVEKVIGKFEFRKF